MDTTELNENLTRLNENIERQLSLKFIIFKGIVYGLATVVGATVVAGIFFSFIANTFDASDEIPGVEEAVSE